MVVGLDSMVVGSDSGWDLDSMVVGWDSDSMVVAMVSEWLLMSLMSVPTMVSPMIELMKLVVLELV